MIRDITLGQYFPGKSLVHRMDARVKIVLVFVLIIFIFIADNLPATLLMMGMVLSAMLLPGVSVCQYLKSLKVVTIVVTLTLALNLFYGSGDILVQWGLLAIRTGGVINCISIAAHIISLVLFSSVLTFTTSPIDLTDALECTMKSLKVFHMKVHEIAMMMMIALRLVPTLLEETDKIMNVQKVRGADMESDGTIQWAKMPISILVSLFVSSFRRAYELAVAMECRCYRGGEGCTKMKSLYMTTLDEWATAASSAACVGVALCVMLPPSLFQREGGAMRNIFSNISYDGPVYHGWQVQNNAISVQEVSQWVMFQVVDRVSDVKACSRTDTGIHTRQFCISTKIERNIPCERLTPAMNHFLLSGVAVFSCREVPMDFHARYSCRDKEYVYQIWNAPVRGPFLYGYALHYWHSMDLEKLNRAAAHYLDTHDFTSFCTTDAHDVGNIVRTVTEAGVSREGDMVRFTVTANGSLYHIVRIMAGTLLRVVQGKFELEQIPQILEQRNRHIAGPATLLGGLHLNRVFYGEEVMG